MVSFILPEQPLTQGESKRCKTEWVILGRLFCGEVLQMDNSALPILYI